MFEARRAWIKWRVLGIRNEHFTIIAQLRSLLTIGRFLRIVVLSQFPGRNENVSSSRPPVSASSSHSLSFSRSFVHSRVTHTGTCRFDEWSIAVGRRTPTVGKINGNGVCKRVRIERS